MVSVALRLIRLGGCGQGPSALVCIGRQPHALCVSSPTTGFVAIGRSTFDLELAADVSRSAFELTRKVVSDLEGSATVLTSSEEVERTVAGFSSRCDRVVIFHGTFADSTLAFAAIRQLTGRHPVLWSVPETRTSRRLRLNSLCGLNLAAFRLGSEGQSASFLHASPDSAEAESALRDALSHPTERPPIRDVTQLARRNESAHSTAASFLRNAKIGVVGDPPDGFEPCEIQLDDISSVIGVAFDVIDIDELTTQADAAESIDSPRAGMATLLALDGNRWESKAVGSVRLHSTLDDLAQTRGWDAMAVRCWPETFDKVGAAVCAPLAALNEDGIPAACEADGLGAATSLLLREVAGEPAFLADLVDLDQTTNTGVLWHCGVAPPSMASPATPVKLGLHPNRSVPLTVNFHLKPGVVTIARLSQSRSTLRLVLGRGEVVDEGPCFTGTSGIVRFANPVDEIFDTVCREGLEHHLGLVYGDHVATLRQMASEWGIPIVEL